MDNTFYYFYSTLTQAFAALIAFVYVATQSRISWLDSKITSEKMVLLLRMNSGTRNVEYYVATHSATQAVNLGFEHTSSDVKEKAEHLGNLISEMQTLRANSSRYISWGIGMVILGLIGILLAPLTDSFNTYCSSALLFISFLFALRSALLIEKFVRDSLKVSLKENI